MYRRYLILFCAVAATVFLYGNAWASEISDIIDVQKYNRAIHIMAMLIAGFGFLMVFVKKYGRSAITATYLLVSISIPLYMMIDGMGIFSGPTSSDIDKLILAEFAAASLLICAGAGWW